MAKAIKQLIVLFLIIFILKVTLAYFIPAPSAFSDYYGNAKGAQSFFYQGDIMVHEVLSAKPPLYPIALSVSYIFKDMERVYFFMKILNAIMSSLIIFPVWLLSREFFNEKKSLYLTLIAAILPANFCFSFLLMSENLSFPLFLFSVYFIYKSFVQTSYKWDLLAGIFIGLTYLTKINGLVLPLIVGCVFLFKLLKKEYVQVTKKLVMAFSFLITISPWLFRNGLLFGFDKHIILGSYSETLEATTSSFGVSFFGVFSIWFILYLGYLMIATGFIFFIASFVMLKRFGDEKIFIFSLLTSLSALFLIILAARHFNLGSIDYKTIFPWLPNRIMGRYVEAVIPLFLINGLLGLKYLKKITKPYVILGIILLFSSQLVFFPLFPVNNMSLTWLGILKFILDFLIYQKITFEPIFSYGYTIGFIVFITAMCFFFLWLQKKILQKKLLLILILFFSLVSLSNFIIIYYNSYTYWYKSEQTQLGLWFNKYDPEFSTILFDERDGCKIFKTDQTCIYNPFRTGASATVIGFWMNDNIKIGPVDNLENIDYVVSKHELDLELLKETKNGIFLYKVNKGANYG